MSLIRSMRRRHRSTASAGAVALTALLAVGCGAASNAGGTEPMAGISMPSGSSPSMAGMDMAASPATSSGVSVGRIKPVPTQTLGTTVWQGMKITAVAMTPVPFLTYNGTSLQEVKPAKNTSFHLMVTLNDAVTGVVIPYASVWATITQGSKIPFDESLWPMISRYMGPHYGNDVSLPGAGTYKLALLISPPVSARHLEYQDVWLKPHKVSFTFSWKPVS